MERPKKPPQAWKILQEALQEQISAVSLTETGFDF